MNFRKLFREPGPPRSRPWEPGREPPSMMEWAAFLPTSSAPLQSAFHTTLPMSQDELNRHASHSNSNSFYRKTSTNMYPPLHSLDDQIYPGLHLHPYPMHENADAPFRYPEKLTSFLNGASPPPPPEVKESRSTWKKRLNFTRKAEHGEKKPMNTIINIHAEPRQSLESRKMLERAVGIFKKKRATSIQSHSVDLDLIPSARPSYLPDDESLLERARMYRGSLDSHFDSIRSRRGMQPISRGENRVNQLQTDQARQTLSYRPVLEATIHGIPVPGQILLDGHNSSPLLPLKLYPPTTTWPQNNLVCNQEKQLPMEPLQLPSPIMTQWKPQTRASVLLPRPMTGPKVNTHKEEEWHHIRSKAVRKFEDWVVRSSQDVPLRQNLAHPTVEKSDLKDTIFKKTPSTMIESEVLHERLSHLLRDEDLRAARGEKRNPVLSHEKRAVVKVKGESRRGNDLARVFEMGGHHEVATFKLTEEVRSPPSHTHEIHSAKNPSTDLVNTVPSSRGFAQKMFSDAAKGQTTTNEQFDEINKPHLSFNQPLVSPSNDDLKTSTSSIERLRPLPSTTAPVSPSIAAQKCEKTERVRSVSSHALMMISPAIDGHMLSLSWGSLGPPTHLAEPKKIDANLNTQAKERANKKLETRKPVEVMPQFGRSVDLNFDTAASYDDGGRAEEEKENMQHSLTGSQMEIIHRIHNWRTQTGTTLEKDFYAPSANATEPSAFFRGEKDDQASSNLTSISRRALAKSCKLVEHTGEQKTNAGKNREKTCQSEASTVICADVNDNQSDDSINLPLQQSEEILISTCKKVDKLIKVVSPPLSPRLANGTKHIRQLSPEESRKLFTMLDDCLNDEPQKCAVPAPVLSSDLISILKNEKVNESQRKVERLEHWQKLVQNLAHDLNDNLDTTVETLLNQYSEEMRQFYKSNPEMLLFVTLRAKLVGAARQESTSTEQKVVDTSSTQQILDNTISSSQADCSSEPDLVSSWLGDERQVERALQKIIDYIENAGEITQIQKSLLGLHQSLLDRSSNNMAMIDRRLSLVSP